MQSICICGSFRFYDEMVNLRDMLQARGFLCEWPTVATRDPKAMTPEEAKAAVTRHLDRIEMADLTFIFNKGGYVGNSVIMEIGYAYARRKPIYALASIPDQFVMSLISAVMSIEDFMQLAPVPQRDI